MGIWRYLELLVMCDRTGKITAVRSLYPQGQITHFRRQKGAICKPKIVVKILNIYGKSGWELVSSYCLKFAEGYCLVYTLKKRIQKINGQESVRGT
ncbi:hypothetical protein PMG71_00720 [Roseofilum sp. BLCC_M154]|uniref:NUMOD4 domain-containing protein n=1 Tax=Roseofilum acuticapitatum BLCC-M154 TaxID=3022444 RepID=A0ABT7ANB3_9CYAN|nr:hypothetical protein [Roseofilum acuticapitatum]MDJ1167944.1 hypothetical protein [Roseofilum acuticapitatum BLCC-M154]